MKFLAKGHMSRANLWVLPIKGVGTKKHSLLSQDPSVLS